MNRLKAHYSKDVVAGLKKEFGYKNIMAVPKITKVVINMGLGEGTQNAKIVDTGAEELGKITGQKAKITIRDNNKVLAAQDVTLKEDGIEQIAARVGRLRSRLRMRPLSALTFDCQRSVRFW